MDKTTIKTNQKFKELKKLVLKKARIKKGTAADNIKLGKMGSWAMLFGNIEWYSPELGRSCKGTCKGP